MNWQLLIKDLRKEMMVSQEELARQLNVAFCTVNRYENKHYEPTFKVQRKLKSLAVKHGLNFDSYKGKIYEEK